ncbi:MAG: DNA polymerase III subunit gamma/tau, partial [Acidimicrobiales bacterium]
MPDGPATPTPLEGVTSLYRRFRPGRFVELRGQDHVVRALRGAVANGRVSHAYLFSGPRGTGKTTSARILAKALNCEEPVDGDACNACASCVAITRGSSLDVIELDAASNNGVDDVRDIVAGAWHGTPGTWKVYIVDEVHQLSKAASAALLKTLEEPPAHVVFVLATTDPHKVLPTIRSRTQHLEFRLFPAETLASLLKDVSDAADLATDVATLEAAVRLGRGSARDALSALDQLLATGAVAEARPTFDGLFEGIVRADAVSTLAALATLVGEGWDPEQLAESLAGELRQVFLLQVAPRVADAVDADRARLVDWGERLGLARTVRILEAVGRAIREMKSAPDKVVILEVALVRLVRPELEATVEALDERLTRLERELRASSPAAPAR